MRRRFLAVATMIGVQCLFGVRSELSSSRPVLIAIPIFGCLVAAASGGFVAKRGFLLPAVVVLLLDWLLIAYALSHTSSTSYSALFKTAWPLAAATLAAAVIGVKVGELLATRRTASPAT
jgi:chromate transport protein ChrA